MCEPFPDVLHCSVFCLQKQETIRNRRAGVSGKYYSQNMRSVHIVRLLYSITSVCAMFSSLD